VDAGGDDGKEKVNKVETRETKLWIKETWGMESNSQSEQMIEGEQAVKA